MKKIQVDTIREVEMPYTRLLSGVWVSSRLFLKQVWSALLGQSPPLLVWKKWESLSGACHCHLMRFGLLRSCQSVYLVSDLISSSLSKQNCSRIYPVAAWCSLFRGLQVGSQRLVCHCRAGNGLWKLWSLQGASWGSQSWEPVPHCPLDSFPALSPTLPFLISAPLSICPLSSNSPPYHSQPPSSDLSSKCCVCWNTCCAFQNKFSFLSV